MENRSDKYQNASIKRIMQGAKLSDVDKKKKHHCRICSKEYACGPAFCGSKVGSCSLAKEWVCGECYEKFDRN